MTSEQVKDIINFHKETAAAFPKRQIRIMITVDGMAKEYTEDIRRIWQYKDTCQLKDVEVIILLHGNMTKMNVYLKNRCK